MQFLSSRSVNGVSLVSFVRSHILLGGPQRGVPDRALPPCRRPPQSKLAIAAVVYFADEVFSSSRWQPASRDALHAEPWPIEGRPLSCSKRCGPRPGLSRARTMHLPRPNNEPPARCSSLPLPFLALHAPPRPCHHPVLPSRARLPGNSRRRIKHGPSHRLNSVTQPLAPPKDALWT